MSTFANYCLNTGGTVKPLIIPSEFTNGTGLFNPSVFFDEQYGILVNIRHCQYTLYHSELGNYQHQWGPLLYLNPQNDNTLTTTNYICKLTDDLDIFEIFKVNTSSFDKKPLWEFVGLEDARIVKWDNKFYLTGVRRDLDTVGTGRMELSEIEFRETEVFEKNRIRIPAPEPNKSYCEKNWMPILDKPYHYVKWSNPVEIVRYDMESKLCETVFLGKKDSSINYDLRGGSQVIQYKDGYLTLQHITHLYKSEAGKKNATYHHQFTYWDKNWNVVTRSKKFSFMGAKIEFSCGMCKYNNDYLITFGFQDNASFILKISEIALEEFING